MYASATESKERLLQCTDGVLKFLTCSPYPDPRSLEERVTFRVRGPVPTPLRGWKVVAVPLGPGRDGPHRQGFYNKRRIWDLFR